MIIIIILLLILVLLFFHFRKKLLHWKVINVPQDIIRNILFSQFKTLFGLRSYPETWAEIYMKHKNSRYYGDYQLYSPILCLRDPELIKTIFVKDFDSFTNRRTFASTEADPIWSNGLFQLEGHRWRMMRTCLTPAYTGTKMRAMFLLIDKVARNFVDYYTGNSEKNNLILIETKDAFSRVTNDVIATCAFGIECNSLINPDNDIYRMAKHTGFHGFWRTLNIMIAQAYPQLTRFLKVEFFQKHVREFFQEFVTQNIKKRKVGGIYRGDMIDLLLEAQGKLYEKNDILVTPPALFCLSNEVMTAQVMNFFTAGFDTTSTMLAFCSYELAINFDIQRRLRDEIDAILITHDNAITYDIINQMKYLDMVVSESMRKWPPALNIGRCCTKPYTIPARNENETDLVIQPGDNILVSIFALHRDPQYYPEPDLFNPERFNQVTITTNRLHPYCYLPFGVGPRQCIAIRFALMEIKTILVRLLSEFELLLCEKTQRPVKPSKKQLNLSPEDGIWLGLRKRIK